MIYHILAVGDVVGEPGLTHLERSLRPLKKLKGIHFTVVNGENAAGVGICRTRWTGLYQAGADVVTLGNHTFGKGQILRRLEEDPYLLRPANYTGRAPGRGYGVYDCGHIQIAVMSLIGRCGLDFNADNPFTTAHRLLAGEGPDSEIARVDFHAEATSEKLAMAYYLDGRVSALWGTHTHVPTADEQILPRGTGYQTDLGMTGAVVSVLGIRPEQSIENFLGGVPGRYQPAEGPCKLQGTVFRPGQRYRPVRSRGAGGHPLRDDLERERRTMSVEMVKEYLAQFGAADRVREFEASTATVELAAQAAGVEPGRIAKTLSFKLEDRTILVVAAGDVKVDNVKYKNTFGGKAKMLTPQEAVERVGHAVGGVCPFAVKEGVEVCLDESLRRFETVLPAAGSANSCIELTLPELEKFSRASRWVDVCKPRTA